MKSYGEKIYEKIVVAKVLRSLTPKYDHVATIIEKFKDLTIFLFDELVILLANSWCQNEQIDYES